jgi:hypothetical protein
MALERAALLCGPKPMIRTLATELPDAKTMFYTIGLPFGCDRKTARGQAKIGVSIGVYSVVLSALPIGSA